MANWVTAMSVIGTIAILYGGGQIPTANQVISDFTEQLLRKGYKVYGVHKSFLGLGNINCYEELDILKAMNITKEPGTYLSTCRKVDPASDKWFENILKTLKSMDIHTILLPGGDGSSRAAVDLVKRVQAAGYFLQIIFVPCTIDGIPNSDTMGIEPAVCETLRHVILMTVNAIATWNPKYILPRIPIIEIQGRNRNDIAVEVLNRIINNGKIGQFQLDDINLILIPTAYEWSFGKLLKQIYEDGRPTVILIAEGAKPVEKYWNAFVGNGSGEKLQNLINADGERETNFDKVGYLSQTNDSNPSSEIIKIKNWAEYTVEAMAMTRKSIAVIKNGADFSTMNLEDFAKATDSDEGIPLSDETVKNLINYLP